VTESGLEKLKEVAPKVTKEVSTSSRKHLSAYSFYELFGGPVNLKLKMRTSLLLSHGGLIQKRDYSAPEELKVV
jgi:hypothetical protein